MIYFFNFYFYFNLDYFDFNFFNLLFFFDVRNFADDIISYVCDKNLAFVLAKLEDINIAMK